MDAFLISERHWQYRLGHRHFAELAADKHEDTMCQCVAAA